MNVVVDAGALVAAERGAKKLGWLRKTIPTAKFIVPACVVAQVWRDGRRQAQLASYLKGCEAVGVDSDAGKRLGGLLAAAGTDDVVDAIVVDLAKRRRAEIIVTSDPDDMERLAHAADLTLEIMDV